jgi:hypothetical protein
MARSGAFFEALTSYYSSLAYDALTLMRTTKEEVRTEKYDWQRTASRTVSLWFDACDGWWSAMLVSATPEVPTILLDVDAGVPVHSHTTKMLIPGKSQPTVTTPVTAGNERALDADVRAEVQSRRDEVTIYLSGMRDAKVGTYTGYLHIDEQLLAQVVVQVNPKPPPAGTNRRKVAAKKAAAAKRKAAAGSRRKS